MKTAYLILEDGHVFEGTRFGAQGEAAGELVFTTGMVGYMETLTDPSYYGQIVTQTFPLIGNYGSIPADAESRRPFLSAYVVREWCEVPSNFRSRSDIDAYLKENGVAGLCGIDTRQLTRILREHGTMNAKIADAYTQEDIDALKNMSVREPVRKVTRAQRELDAPDEVNYHVTLIDYGAKQNIIRELKKRGCAVTIVPADTAAADILAGGPDGVMLSNGPGDPQDNQDCIAQIQKLLGKVPVFGICLGHQLLALANGGRTVKLKYGHRGANQPVTRLEDGRTFISSQNHGYAVVCESVEEHGGRITYLNANDRTCEGICYPGKNAFSVQFHPEACSGPRDTSFLFDDFIKMMGGNA